MTRIKIKGKRVQFLILSLFLALPLLAVLTGFARDARMTTEEDA